MAELTMQAMGVGDMLYFHILITYYFTNIPFL